MGPDVVDSEGIPEYELLALCSRTELRDVHVDRVRELLRDPRVRWGTSSP